ncbi:MAG TPA: hypothetical protein PLN56_10700 [Methanoregulaceae archaeon]|nr:hypothetical protein [Sedimentisphaerales bacterium]HPD11447.1 hypothetical protein [Methanoregulaceae archaeon]
MPYLLQVTPGKEKLVQNILVQQGQIVLTIPNLYGFLIHDDSIPLKGHESPHIMAITEISEEQVKKMLRWNSENKTFQKGMKVVIVRGKYKNCTGIVRRIRGESLVVDVYNMGKMTAVSVPVEDLKRV